jgi:hypothetical protein
VYSLICPFPALPCSSPVTDWWTIELGDADASGDGPIWPQSGGADFASNTFKFVVATTLVLLAIALLLSFVLPIEEEVHMPKLPSSTPAKPTPSTGSKTAELCLYQCADREKWEDQ